MDIRNFPMAKIVGPFWIANARLIRSRDPGLNLALRTLFVENQPRPAFGHESVFVPGTLLILCQIHRISIRPEGPHGERYNWKRQSGPPIRDPSITEIREGLASGELSLLLLQAPEDDWPEDDNKQARIPTLTCLAGDINLDVMVPLQQEDQTENGRQRLYRALTLREVAASPGPLTGKLSVNGSGLSIHGQIKLPWKAERVTAPFLLAKEVPAPPSPKEARFRLRLEEERLTDLEKLAWIQSWFNLSSYLNPNHPLHKTEELSTTPVWTTLEIADPLRVPGIYWRLLDWEAAPANLPPQFKAGEFNLLLSDQELYEPQLPSRSVAQIPLKSIQINEGVNDTLHIDLLAGEPQAEIHGRVQYSATAPADPSQAWQETVTILDTAVAFNPVTTARLLRQHQDLLPPEWEAGEEAEPINTPTLWGFMPLTDGWAQLPIPNLTEQLYLDTQIANLKYEEEATLVKGAFALSNQQEAVLPHYMQEQPWQMALTDIGNLQGQWQLQQNGDGYQLFEIALDIESPQLQLSGFFWLSSGKPTIEDALPDLENWVCGLQTVPLRTFSRGNHIFPPSITLQLETMTLTPRSFPVDVPTLTSTQLGAWAFAYQTHTQVFADFVNANVLPEEMYGRYLPLIWRRHPTHPMIQVLPLTQSKSPPNHPSGSRQLAPYEIQPENLLRFGVDSEQGASSWVRYLGADAPAVEWRELVDLPMTSLTLPGFFLDPSLREEAGFGQEPGLNLTRQYRYDLPYLDENYALAQLPKKPQDPNEVSPLPDAPPPEPEKPLLRESLADHWQQLAEKASLASVAGVFAFLSENGELFANHLIEPLRWPVQTSLDLDNYPGTLTLKNQDDNTELTLSGTEALAGITGRFLVDDDARLQLLADTAVPNHPPYEIIANSMAAHAQDGRYQDQRGLWRTGTVVQGNLLKTAVTLHEHADQPVTLTSTLTSVPLTLSETESWQVWLRDLPVQAGEFLRSATLSALAQDVNDPEAKSRQFNYLNGYEWRLGAESELIRLNRLIFYPLTLENVTVVDDHLTHVEIVGRLQLPLLPEIELKDLNNAVRLTFTVVDSTQPLQLTNLTCEGPFVEWPLALQNGEQTDAPRLKWHTIHLQRDDQNRPQLLIEQPQLCFFLFDVEWNVTLQDLLFGAETTELLLQNDDAPPDSGQPLLPTLTEISLNSETGLHHAWQTIQMRLGHSQRPSLRTDIRFPLMPQTTDPVTAVTSHLFLDLELRDERLHFSQNSLQIVWSNCDPIDTLTEPIHLLPGMPLSAEFCPGFAALTFTAVSPSPPIFPQLTLQSAFVETLFTSQWGHFLQSSQLHPDETLTQIFGSSAGELAFGYTVQWLTEANGAPRWDESFLVNGMLEITNLLSWPQQTSLDPENNTLTLPSVGQAETLDHIRHTIRILLNQHLISSDVLAIGAGSLLFNLQPDKVWQFLAVVEHQLVAILPNAAFDEFAIGAEQRWTTNQEVRLARPPVFQAFLQEMTGKVIDPRHGLAGLHQQSGYHQQFIKAQLLDDDSPDRLAILPNDTLIVEASAPHWIRKTPLAFEEEAVASRPSTTLQYLPNGSQLATLSNLTDYFDADASPDSWLLLTTPFLGRLQTAVYDGLTVEGRDELNALQIDPILRLHHLGSTNPGQPLPQLSLAFSSWGDGLPVTINSSPFDDAVARGWPRLDPLSLEENWFRLQNPVDEAVAVRTQSVMAAFPNTPARLSRSAALRQTFATFRHHYPPQLEPQTVAPPASHHRLEWRIGSVMVWQDVGAVTDAQPDIYAWYGTAQQLFSSHLTAAQNRAIYPAATIIPARLSQNGQENPVPVSVAVSPYTTLDFKPDPAVDLLKLASIELLCLAPGSNSLRPVTSLLRELTTSAETFYAFSLGWGREMAQRLCPESPLAILRFREIRQDSANLAEVTIHFRFDFVAAAPPASLTKRVFRLRSSLETLRAREGHFGSMEMPEVVAAFELAPPQITGIQPIYLHERPVTDANGRWPWGLSSLRFSSVISAGREGALGNRLLPSAESPVTTLWWQALPFQVMFRSALTDEGPAAGLPALFRADAVDHFLPISPQPTLPSIVSLVSEDEEEAGVSYVWQPLLPGQVRFHQLGSRAGAMFALRNHLIRQQGMMLNEAGTQLSGGRQMVSGSVPVQHRMPRPVPLPENVNVDSALRPWASPFDPQQNHLLTPAPADEAFFAARADQPDQRLQIQIVSPAHGKITPAWNGELVFMMKDGEGLANLANWELDVYLAGTGIKFKSEDCPNVVEPSPDLQYFCLTNNLENDLNTVLQSINQGETILLHIDVRPATAQDEFNQTCVFPLRMGHKTGFRLPLIPQFIHFEDPEYNRALASVVKRAEKQFQVLQNGELVMRSIILATDRQQYNPDSTLAFRFDWDDSADNSPPVHELEIKLTRIGSNNIQWLLQTPTALAGLKAGQLHQLSLAELVGDSPEAQNPPILLPGDRLQITIMFDAVPNSTDPPDVQVVLAVEIVAEPVIPVPQAAYALLRWQTVQERNEVECVRFAWGPTAVRIDLINPDDLKTEVVRWRAVFHWTDSVRPETDFGYMIQKITQTGATEVPLAV